MVVEDEALTNDFLCGLLSKEEIIVTGFTNSLKAFDYIRTESVEELPDVMFLDIEMPEMDGLFFAEKTFEIGYKGEIVFITAYREYAVEAFRISALDYLVKPIRLAELRQSIDRVKRMKCLKDTGMNLNLQKIKLNLFGNMSLQVGDTIRPIHWTTLKCAEVFAFLSLQGADKPVTKWKLMDKIWMHKDSDKADINLRSTISRMNKTLRENNTNISVENVGSGYTITMEPSSVDIDIKHLEELAMETIGIDETNLETYENLIGNYKPILEEFNSDWCYEVREKYHRYFVHGAKKLIHYYERTNVEPLKILNMVEHIIKYNPYEEEFMEMAFLLHYKIGGKTSAERYYEQKCQFLQKELQIEPSKSMQSLYQWVMEN